MKNKNFELKVVEQTAIKLKSERFLVITKLETTEKIVTDIVSDINRIMISDTFADKMLDPVVPGLWWIRHTSDNKKLAEVAAENINLIINSVKGKGV